MCSCIVSLTAQVRLICSWCMKICLRRAARISTERLISVQTDEQTEIDMETNMAENMGDKSIYIRAFWHREINQSIQRSIQSNNRTLANTIPVKMFTNKQYYSRWHAIVRARIGLYNNHEFRRLLSTSRTKYNCVVHTTAGLELPKSYAKSHWHDISFGIYSLLLHILVSAGDEP